MKFLGNTTINSLKNSFLTDQKFILKGIDNNLRDLIVQLNKNPHITTTLSCGGHYRQCKKYLPKRIVDDIDKKSQIDDEIQYYCTSSNQPFLQFKCTKELCNFVKCLSLIDSKLGKLTYFKDTFIYSYGDGDEGYPEYVEDMISPRFKEFWTYFAYCWNKYVCKEFLSIPSYYPLNEKCFQCESKFIVKEEEIESSYLDLELFTDHDSYYTSLILEEKGSMNTFEEFINWRNQMSDPSIPVIKIRVFRSIDQNQIMKEKESLYINLSDFNEKLYNDVVNWKDPFVLNENALNIVKSSILPYCRKLDEDVKREIEFECSILMECQPIYKL